MLVGNIKDRRIYETAHPLFSQAFDFIKKQLEDPKPVGKYEILGDALFAMVQEYDGKTEAKMEVHDKYIDLQFLLDGEEEIDVEDLSRTEVHTAYDPASDYEAHTSTAYTTLRMKKFDCAVLFPEDVHRPGVKTVSDTVRKIVVKIAV